METLYRRRLGPHKIFCPAATKGRSSGCDIVTGRRHYVGCRSERSPSLTGAISCGTSRTTTMNRQRARERVWTGQFLGGAPKRDSRRGAGTYSGLQEPSAMTRRNSRGAIPLKSRLKREISRKPAANAISAIFLFRRFEQITRAGCNPFVVDVLPNRASHPRKQLVYLTLRAMKFSAERPGSLQ